LGTFEIPLEVGDLAGQRFVEVNALVDTGSTYTVVPSNILSNLGVPVLERRPFELADESIVEYAIGQARVRLDGRELTVVVVFAPEDSSPLLGATTLELFSLGVDPVAQRLVPVTGLMK
jgi:clan AA aspartic protease